MASSKGPVKKGQPSIKHTCKSAEAKRKLSKMSGAHYAFAFQRHNTKRGDSKLCKILSRDALVSAVDLLWDRSDVVPDSVISSLNDGHLDRDHVSKLKVQAESTPLPADLEAKSHFPSTSQPRVKLLRVSEKMCSFNQNYNRSLFSWFDQTTGAKSMGCSCKRNGFPFEARWEIERIHSWMEELAPAITRYHRGGAEIEKRQNSEDCIPSLVSSKAECVLRNADSCDSVFVTDGAEGLSTCPLLASITESSGDTKISRSTDANYLFLLYKDRCASNKRVNTVSTECSTDGHSEISSSGNNSIKNKQFRERDSKEQQTDLCSSSTEKSTSAFAKQRHAFAGALAGISVSLCLHPLDTVKTMIQSSRLEEKSLCSTGRSIISERGFSGLYRGIASNIATSAPISALYTFTYESIKGALLPLFSKEYRSLSHCVAGGSASIATSFIFTPSERIKQQMQVSSHYRNCWTALVGIIQKGGLLSLYAGWSAVLCRNIPHSIIKFYVYENMKQIFLPSLYPHGQVAQPTTFQTLICGGLAGSAAAFFTTPFDVVKTRLQTQIPGSRNQHISVYQTLQAISKQEGLRGLYRGLIPRLVMYMSQGAIFFASYEFYKSVFSLEVTQPNSSALSETKQKVEIDKDISPPVKPTRMQHM